MNNLKKRYEKACNDYGGGFLQLPITVGYLRSCPCKYFKLSTNVDGANSTKPMLPAGADYLAGF